MDKNSSTHDLTSETQFSLNKVLLLKIIAIIVVLGFIAAVLYHFVYQDLILDNGYPLNTFLFLQTDRFNDFYGLRDLCKTNNPYFAPSYEGNSNYLPIANLIFWLFSYLPKQLSLIIYIGISSILIYLFSYLFIPKTETKIKRHMYAFIISFLSYGYLFCVDRANIEPYVAVSIMAFLFFYLKQQHKLAILFLAIATATKIYPIIFILLYVSDKKYKEAAVTVLCTIVLIIVPLFLQKGGFQANLYFILNGFELDLNTASFGPAFDDKGNKMLQGTSLFSVFKLLNIKLSLKIAHLLVKYFVLVAIVALFTVAYVVFIEKALWRKVTLLTCLVLILPHISFDYKFIHLLYCIYLFINEPKKNSAEKINYKIIAIIFGLLLIPKSYMYFSDIFSSTTNKYDIPIGTLINPLLISCLMFIIIRSGMKYFKFSELKNELLEHIPAFKKAFVYILPIILLLIPYYSFSIKAKAEYNEYKKHYYNSQECFDTYKLKEAIDELQAARKIKNYKFQLPLKIAYVYCNLGNWDSAFVYFDKTLAIYPECYEAQSTGFYAKAMVYFEKGIFSDALVHFKSALIARNESPIIYPDNQAVIVDIYTKLSVCNINLQNWNDAKKNLEAIELIQPYNDYLISTKEYIEKMLNESKK